MTAARPPSPGSGYWMLKASSYQQVLRVGRGAQLGPGGFSEKTFHVGQFRGAPAGLRDLGRSPRGAGGRRQAEHAHSTEEPPAAR